MTANNKKGRVLIIAGSDSGGGAGIQADIKTVTALGGYAATAITALTAQNTQGVFGIHEVEDDFIAQQMRLVLDDIGADAIKTGMLHKASAIETVAKVLRDYPDIPLIVDPVMVAKGGAPLLKPDAINVLVKKLFPRAFLITPNVPEAELLLGCRLQVASCKDMEEAGRHLLNFDCKAALVKGGHLAGEEVTDVLVSTCNLQPDPVMGGTLPPSELRSDSPAGSSYRTPPRTHATHHFSSPRIHTHHTHGTGCTLASAIATGIAQGLPLIQAVERARAYVLEAIKTAPGLGKGHGPLNHGHPFFPKS